MNNEVQAFWERFLEKENLPKETTCLESFYFDVNRENARELCDLVLKGIKKATASSFYHYEETDEQMPKVGDYSIVTDYDGHPYAVIKTTQISIIPFKDLTFNIVKREGEDENLKSWQKNHIKFFTYDAKKSGYVFDFDMPVVFEDFEVVYQEKEACCKSIKESYL